MNLGEGEREFLRMSFREYYYRTSDALWIPPALEEREIGVLAFDGYMKRHMAFPSRGEFISFVLREVPWGMFYSVSRYGDPSNPDMNEKGWRGADLVFDIDVKDLKPPCIAEHDFMLCGDGEVRGLEEKGNEDAQGCNRVDWVCPSCIEAGREEVMKMLDILTDDLGVSSDRVTVYYSGHRGFHVHVDQEELSGLDLDRGARAQILDYLTLKAANPRRLEGMLPESLADADVEGLLGWPRRIAEAIRRDGITHKRAPGFGAALQAAIASAGVRVDPQVTLDISRIFRLPTSLSEKTGLKKAACDDVMACDPLERAVAIGDEVVKVEISYAPKLTLGGYTYGPFRKAVAKLPGFVAAFMISKGVAKLASPGTMW